ncbi:MAG: histidine--tRNA ligase [Bacteroidota bacterium]
MAQKPSVPRGTRDFLPAVMIRREFIFDTIRKVFKKYGYAPLETPSLERLDVLTGKYGEEGDRLIFKILNSGDFLQKARSLDDSNKLASEIAEKGLRYDLTVPFARVVVMHQNELSFPFKRYQIQPVWRADRPQKGRYREFYQCDADVVGSDSLLFEAEFIAIYDEALSTMGLKDFSIMVNNRKILTGYADLLGKPEKVGDICIAIDKWDKIGKEGVEQELDKRGIGEKEAQQLFEILAFEGTFEEKLSFLSGVFQDSDIGQTGVQEMQTVWNTYQYLDRFQGSVDFNLRLARGLDYYTGTIYEVKANHVKIGSIGGGGRYDNLTGVFGKPGLSGVGISFGADRIYDVLEALDLFDSTATSVEIMLVNFGEPLVYEALGVLSRLRKEGIQAEMYPDAVKLKKQFTYANKKGIKYLLLLGEEEKATGSFQLKNMEVGTQESLNFDQLLSLLRP